MNAVVQVREHHRLNFNRLPALAKQQIDTAQLTPMYESAKRELIALARVDEVKDIADKHSAIAHYAKQIKDNSLLHYAERVYARALARIGELLDHLPKSERAALAKKHGVSPSDAAHAINIAALPNRARDALIERNPPASKNELSSAGSILRKQEPRWRGGFDRYAQQEPAGKIRTAIEVIAAEFETEDVAPRNDLERHAKRMFISTDELTRVTPDEASHLRKQLAPLIEYLDEIDQRLALREAGK
jgi:hypothetical protein